MSSQEFVTFGGGNSSELVVFCFYVQLTFQVIHFLTVGVTIERCQTDLSTCCLIYLLNCLLCTSVEFREKMKQLRTHCRR